MTPKFLLPTMAALLALAIPSAHATIDMSLDNPGVITGPTNVTIQVTVDSSSGDTGCWGGMVELQYDPTKVSLSSPVADHTGYAIDGYNTDAAHGLEMYLSTGTTEITSTCDYITFTVTPVGTSADLSDCSVLQMLPGDVTQPFTSELVNQDLYLVPATGSCSSGDLGLAIRTGPSPDTETSGSSGSGEAGTDSFCVSGINDIARILKISGGIAAATADDMVRLDWDADGHIGPWRDSAGNSQLSRDAIIEARMMAFGSPGCPILPDGWYTFQGDGRRLGRAAGTISKSMSDAWSLNLGVSYPTGSEPALPPSVLAVPDGANTAVFGVVSSGSTVTAFRATYNGTTAPTSATTNSAGLYSILGKVGRTPVYENGLLFVTVNKQSTSTAPQRAVLYVLNASDLSLAALGTGISNPIPLDNPSGTSSTGTDEVSVSPLAVDPWNGGILLTVDISDAGGTAAYVYCKNPLTGADLWTPTRINSATANRSSVSVTGDAVYVVNQRSGGHQINIFNARTGAVINSQTGGGYVDSSLVIDDGRILYGNENINGSGAWYDSRALTASPITQIGTAIPAGTLGSISAADTLAGHADTLHYALFGTPAVDPATGAVVFDSVDSEVFALNAADATTNYWANTQIGPSTTTYASPVIAKDTTDGTSYAYVGSDNGFLYRFSVPTLANAFPNFPNPPTKIGVGGVGGTAMNGKIRSSIAAYGGCLYILTTTGRLYCFH